MQILLEVCILSSWLYYYYTSYSTLIHFNHHNLENRNSKFEALKAICLVSSPRRTYWTNARRPLLSSQHAVNDRLFSTLMLNKTKVAQKRQTITLVLPLSSRCS